MNKKQSFYKIYSNLPLNIREEIVIVYNDEPISWKVVKLYVDEDTKSGKEILEKMEKLNII